MFYIITNNIEERTMLIRSLRECGILAVFHYIPLHSSPAGRRYGRTVGGMSITDEISDCVLRLPLYYEMNLSDVETVVQVIKQFYEK